MADQAAWVGIAVVYCVQVSLQWIMLWAEQVGMQKVPCMHATPRAPFALCLYPELCCLRTAGCEEEKRVTLDSAVIRRPDQALEDR